jgi:hypothetical protein
MSLMLDDANLNYDRFFTRSYFQLSSPAKLQLKKSFAGARVDEDLSLGLGARPTLMTAQITDNVTCSIQAPTFQKYRNYRQGDKYHLTKVYVAGVSGWRLGQQDTLRVSLKFSNTFRRLGFASQIWIDCLSRGYSNNHFGYRDLFESFKDLSIDSIVSKFPINVY